MNSSAFRLLKVTMKRLQLKFYLLPLMALLFSSSSYALPDSQKLNLREACRQAVAGEYISAFDSLKISTTYLNEVAKMIARIEVVLAAEEKTLLILRAKIERVTYNLQLSDQVIQQNEKVRALESTLNLYREQSGIAKEKILIVKHRESYLKSHIESVFNIVKGQGVGQDFPTAITYKADCPKYRHMCSLPEKYHDALEHILLKEDTESVCQRYISFSKSGKR